MMPTHGFGIFRSMLIGSVTAKVLHDAKCPVWTAAHAEEQRAAVTPKTIVCAIDGPTEETASLVRWAVEFSKETKAALRLLHVVPPVSDWLAIPSEIEFYKQLRAEAQATLEPFLKQAAHVEAPVRVVIGKLAEIISEEANQEGADLVITGRGHSHAALSRLRSHVFGIVQQAHCPVLSV
jgi:nucleotide-binding universal stress UspA family protein